MSLRNTSKALVIFKDNKRSHVSVWNWIQRFAEYPIYKRKRISAFIIDETVIQIGSQHFWLWFCIEPIHRSYLEYTYLRREICLLLKNSLESLVSKYGRHPVYTDGGTWYDEACNILRLKRLFTFTIRKKSNGKGQSIFQRQDREF